MQPAGAYQNSTIFHRNHIQEPCMETLQLLIIPYFSLNMAAFCLGMVFYLTVENFQPAGRQPRKVQNVFVIMALCMFFTPLGAYIASLVAKSKGSRPGIVSA